MRLVFFYANQPNITFTMTFMTFNMSNILIYDFRYDFRMTFKAQSHKLQMASYQALWQIIRQFYDFYEFRETFLPLSFFGDYLFFFFAPRSQVSQKSSKSYFSAILAS